MSSKLTQMFPPKPSFTEKDLPDLSGKVYLITGSNTGVGKALAQLLYGANGTVFIAARSESKCREAIAAIQASNPDSKGRLEFLSLDLADLAAVRQAVQSFLAATDRLDVLVQNAGVMHPPAGSKTAQGYELQLGVHCLGPVLLAELLTPLLARTAAREEAAGRPKGGVRVAWAASLYAEMAPKGGFDPDNMNYEKKDKDVYYKYSVSKAGAIYQGVEYARRHRKEGITSVPFNPGNLKTDLQRHHSGLLTKMAGFILYPAINGAYTELFAALSPEVTLEKSGYYVVPWGRFQALRSDLQLGTRSISDGGSGMAEKWYDWCLEQVKPYLKD